MEPAVYALCGINGQKGMELVSASSLLTTENQQAVNSVSASLLFY